jgi:hypothetical protein
MLSTLAATHAEAGDFKNAVRWQSKAIESAAERDRAGMQSRLELFKAGRPYRKNAD